MSAPNGWITTSVGKVFSAVGGGTPSTNEPSFWGGAIPWISSADIDDSFELHPRRGVTEIGLENSAASAVPKGSVIVVTRVGLGKVGLVKDGPICFSQDNQALLPVGGVDQRFTAYQMKWAAISFLRQSRGTTISGITKKQFNETLFQLPPTREQERIADAIDEMLSDLDTGVEALKRVQVKLGHYRAAVLKAAVEGALTADWREQHPDTEPASELLKRILNERRRRWEEEQLRKFKAAGKQPPKGWQTKYKEPAAPDTTNLPTLPEGWCWATVEQLAAIEPNSITDGPFGSNLKTEHYTESGPRVIRLQNIKDGVFADERAHVSQERFEALRKHQVKSGDIVIAALGDSPPRACILPESVGPAIVKADCIRFKPHEWFSTAYLNYCLNSHPTRTRTKESVHGIGRPRLNLDEVRGIVLAIPPSAEQPALTEQIDDHLSIIDHLEGDVDEKLLAVQALRQSILRHAFTGQLVPQDPKDEPASELLKRIAAEREARGKIETKKSRGRAKAATKA